jgi:hypothetical protein
MWQQPSALADKNARGVCEMKNPLDSLGQTVILGLVLTVVVAVLIPVIGG